MTIAWSRAAALDTGAAGAPLDVKLKVRKGRLLCLLQRHAADAVLELLFLA